MICLCSQFDYIDITSQDSFITLFIKTIAFITPILVVTLFSCKQNSDNINQVTWLDTRLTERDKLIYKNDHLFTGILQDSFDNGQIKYSKSIVEGKANGVVTGWHYDGEKSYEYSSIEGKKEGPYSEYYPNGNLQIKSRYHQDTIIAHKVLDINGTVLVNFKIKDGRTYGLLGSSECRSVFNNDSFSRKEE